jgi:capsular polysaccharide biosynthesis protein
VEFHEYVAVLARRWWVVVLVVIAAMVAAFVTSRMQAPTYRSTVRLEATSRIDYGQVLASERLLRQLAARARTTAVAQEVERRLRTGSSPEELVSKVRSLAVPEVLHVQLEVDDADPERARRIAQSWAEVVQERQIQTMIGIPEADRIQLTVLDQASPAARVGTGLQSTLGAAALLGLLVGALLAFVLEYATSSSGPSRSRESA